MKRIGFIFCFIIYTSYSFGQQFLWSTEEKADIKHVPLENVTNEVLEFYDHYEYYYDGAGYSKNGFLKYIEKFGDDSETWEGKKIDISEIEDLTVFAFRGNLGRGSVVLIISINRNDVNFIAFSNTYERDAISTDRYEKRKFSKWFNTLLNLTTHTTQLIDEPIILNPNLPTLDDIIGDITDDPIEMEDELGYGGYGEGEFDVSGDGIFGRKVIYRDPSMVRLVNGKSGKIVFKVCINRRGIVSYIEIDKLRTTIKDTKTLRDGLESMRKYKYEVDYSAAEEQCGHFSIILNNYKGIRN